jgi:hypothetical protein
MQTQATYEMVEVSSLAMAVLGKSKHYVNASLSSDPEYGGQLMTWEDDRIGDGRATVYVLDGGCRDFIAIFATSMPFARKTLNQICRMNKYRQTATTYTVCPGTGDTLKAMAMVVDNELDDIATVWQIMRDYQIV